VFDGPSTRAIQLYQDKRGDGGAVFSQAASPDAPRIVDARLTTSDPPGLQRNGAPMTVEVTVDFPAPLANARLVCEIESERGTKIVRFAVHDHEQPLGQAPGRYRCTCHIPRVRLYRGRYTMSLFLCQAPRLPILHQLEGVLPFEVQMLDQPAPASGWRPGMCVYTEDAAWEVRRATDASASLAA
jgi:lipopolysaccharide transport system ATP-binding protein